MAHGRMPFSDATNLERRTSQLSRHRNYVTITFTFTRAILKYIFFTAIDYYTVDFLACLPTLVNVIALCRTPLYISVHSTRVRRRK